PVPSLMPAAPEAEPEAERGCGVNRRRGIGITRRRPIITLAVVRLRRRLVSVFGRMVVNDTSGKPEDQGTDSGAAYEPRRIHRGQTFQRTMRHVPSGWRHAVP